MELMEPHKRGQVLHSDARQIVFKVINYLEKEKTLGHSFDVKKSNARAAMATGLSKTTICKIKREGIKAKKMGVKIATPGKGERGLHNSRIPVDNAMLSGIRAIIGDTMYSEHIDIPTLEKLISVAKRDFNFKGGRNSLRSIIKKKLGFYYKKCKQNKRVLLEQESIKASRIRYLRHLKQNDSLGDQKKPLVYLDEPWITSDPILDRTRGLESCGFNKKNDDNYKDQRWVIVNAGNEFGFLGSPKTKKRSCFGMDGVHFEKYIKEKLMAFLPSKSIVVMAYDGQQIKKSPTSTWPKVDVQKWLLDQKITFNTDWTKAELIDLVQRNKPPKKYVIDEFLTRQGHDVLRLSPCNCDLNPIEYIWDLVKKRASEKSDRNDKTMEELTNEALDSISAQDWLKEVERVKSLASTYWVRDVCREDELNDFIVSLDPESDDNSDDEYQDDAQDTDDEDVVIKDEIIEDDDSDPGSSQIANTVTIKVENLT